MANSLQPSTYRYDIDGLKGIAILAVVFYHVYVLTQSAYLVDLSFIESGFLGVDVFFVISGFLITASIYKKLESGAFSLSAFYKTRYQRIVPPLAVLSIFCLTLGYFLVFKDVYRELVIEIANTLVFIGNFRLANSNGYFSLEASEKLFLHTWYLCITFQFYIIYPLILVLFKKLLKQRIRVGVVALFLLTFIASYILSMNGNGYLLTQTRIWELFFGGVVFFYKDDVKVILFERRNKLPLIVQIIGLAAIIWSIFFVRLDYGSWYIKTSIITVVGTALVILANQPNRIFKYSGLSYLGKVSYSLYLWHWPVMIFMMKLNIINSQFFFIYLAVTVIVISLLSYYLLEQKKIPIVITISLVAICAIFYIYFRNEAHSNYLSKFVVKQEQVIPQSQKELDSHKLILKNGLDVTVFTKDNKTPHIFWIGDSHANQFYEYISSQSTPVYFYSNPATMAYDKYFASMKNFLYPNLGRRGPSFYERYKGVLELLTSSDKVILNNHWFVYYSSFIKENNLRNLPNSIDLYIKALIKQIDEQIVMHPNIHFYIVGPGVITTQSLVDISSLDLKDGLLSKLLNKNSSYTLDYFNDNNLKLLNALDEYQKTRKNVSIIDRRPAILVHSSNGDSNISYYLLKKDNKNLFKDNNHYSPYGSQILGRYILQKVIESNVE